MLEPLKQFICDKCHQVIETPEDGWVEWLDSTNELTGNSSRHGFKIVHRSIRDENGKRKATRCYFYDGYAERCDNHLEEILGRRKMEFITGFLDPGVNIQDEFNGPGVSNIREYVEFIRRLTLPYYEEARLYFTDAKNNSEFEGRHEMSAYTPEFLMQIIEDYGDREDS